MSCFGRHLNPMSGLKYLPKRLIKTQETQANSYFYERIQSSGSMCQNNYQEHCWSVIGRDRTSRLLKGLAIRGNNRGKTGTTTICWHCFAVSIYTERSAIIPWNSESLIMCYISACGLQCYQCISTKSWDDCESVKTKVNCSSSENRCSKGYEDIKKGGVSVKGRL